MENLSSAWRIDSLFCQCEQCGDSVELITYVRRAPGRDTLCRLEPTQDAIVRQGALSHRPGHCGGQLVAFGRPETLVLQDCRRAV